MKTIRGKILLLLFIYLSTSVCFPQRLQFFSEKISIEVKGDYCIVTGWYWFINNGNKSVIRNLNYPFLLNEVLPYPHKFEVHHSNKKDCLPAVSTAKGIMFNINADAGDTVLYIVKYWQNTPAHQMEYILTTTKEWGTPLVKSEYLVTIPPGLELLKMIPEYDTVIEHDSIKIFSIQKENFLPEENFKIIWKGDCYEVKD